MCTQHWYKCHGHLGLHNFQGGMNGYILITLKKNKNHHKNTMTIMPMMSGCKPVTTTVTKHYQFTSVQL